MLQKTAFNSARQPLHDIKLSARSRAACCGFTILEAVVVLAIVTLGMLALGSLFIWQSSFYALETNKIDVDEAHNATLEAFARDVRTGRAIAETYGGYTSATSTMVIETPMLGAETNESSFDYIVYFVSSTNILMRKVIAAQGSDRISGERPLHHAVETLEFTYDVSPPEAQTVTMDLESEATARGRTYTRSDALSVSLRNK